MDSNLGKSTTQTSENMPAFTTNTQQPTPLQTEKLVTPTAQKMGDVTKAGSR